MPIRLLPFSPIRIGPNIRLAPRRRFIEIRPCSTTSGRVRDQGVTKNAARLDIGRAHSLARRTSRAPRDAPAVFGGSLAESAGAGPRWQTTESGADLAAPASDRLSVPFVAVLDADRLGDEALPGSEVDRPQPAGEALAPPGPPAPPRSGRDSASRRPAPAGPRPGHCRRARLIGSGTRRGWVRQTGAHPAAGAPCRPRCRGRSRRKGQAESLLRSAHARSGEA